MWLTKSYSSYALFIVNVCIGFCLLIGCGKKMETIMSVGEVVDVKGMVVAVNVENKTRQLILHSPIFPKDILYTEQKSYLTLRFTDGTLMTLRPNTTVKINRYVFLNTQDDECSIKLKAGGLSVLTGKISATKFSAFTVTTPVGGVSILEREGYMAYEPDEGMAFEGVGIVYNAKAVREVKVDDVLITNLDEVPKFVVDAPDILLTKEARLATEYLFMLDDQYKNKPRPVSVTQYPNLVNADVMKKEDGFDDFFINSDDYVRAMVKSTL